MPGKTRAPRAVASKGLQTGAGIDTSVARQPRGNEAAQARLGEPGGSDAGLASYEGALGEFLGGELYRAVQGALGFDRVKGHAHSAVGAALGALGDRLAGVDGVKADPAAIEALVGLLQAQLDPVLDGWLDGDGRELQAKLAGWAGASPRTVAGIALLAACGAVLANLEIPALEKRLHLGDGTDLEVEAELGRLRAAALRKVRAVLTHTSGPLIGALEVSHGEGGTTGAASVRVAEVGRTVEAKGTFDGDGLVVAGLSGEVKTAQGTTVKGRVSNERDREGAVATLGVARDDGPLAVTGDFAWDAGTGVMTVGASALRRLESAELSVSGSAGSDGSRAARAGVVQRKDWGELSASASSRKGAWGLSEEERLQIGVKYDREGLRASLDAAVARADGATTGTFSAKAEKDLGEGRRVGASLDLSAGADRLVEAGAYYGFKDPQAFRSWLLEYRHSSKLDDHQFKVAVEQTLGPVLLRAQSALAWGGSGRTVDASAHGAYFREKDTALIAGGSYRKDYESGRSSFTPEVGMQHKGVQVLFGYDAESKAATIRLGVPF